MRWPDLGPLHERAFRLLVSSSTISFTGSAFTNVALAFAILDLTGSKADLGFVLAARTLPTVVFLLVGGIWADRLPRHHVMVASNVLSGLSQATVAALLFSGHARVWQIAALAAVNGASSAFFFPAASGITPQTVPESLLQQANAVLRLGRNSAWIVGGALAGVVVAATSPATGIAVDSATFFVAAALTAAMHIPSSMHMQGSQGVLGPAVAKEHFGGAAAWGLIAATQALGLVAGGVLMLRLRPRRLLLVATLGFLLTSPLLFGLGVPVPLPAVVALAFVAGLGSETFGVLWDTSMQQEIPQDRLSRVYSYDALGSAALIPLGLALAGPVADAIGTRAAVFAAGAISLSATLAVLLVRDVRTLRRRGPVDLPQPAFEPAT